MNSLINYLDTGNPLKKIEFLQIGYLFKQLKRQPLVIIN